IMEGVDYVFVGVKKDGDAAGHYVMTGYDEATGTFGSTHEQKNGDVTLGGNGYHLTVADKNVAIVNFEKQEEGVWAMKFKDGKHIARGESGKAVLSDDPDHVLHNITDDGDGYTAYFVHGGDEAQSFQFDGSSFNSATGVEGAPIYIYATNVAVDAKSLKFADEATATVTLTTRYDNRMPVRETFNAVNLPDGGDDFIHLYYEGLATLDDAKKMSDDELSWRYKYNDSDWFKAPAEAGQQTSKVAMHVEVEMLGDADGENLSYKKADPNNPGDWTDTDYIKHSGVNQVYMADTDKPYIKVPAISKYSIVKVTATGDGDTHQGEASPAEPMVYVRAGDKGTTSIDAIGLDGTDGDTIYYNLQGVRVYNPGSGIYIRVQGHNATKVNVVR
ncbi:MAG: hypothetical protein K2L81_00885, partial [Muribaculaceae bacterium]|nr:hypothetical protein [Muribaculaceae bacterium]